MEGERDENKRRREAGRDGGTEGQMGGVGGYGGEIIIENSASVFPVQLVQMRACVCELTHAQSAATVFWGFLGYLILACLLFFF